MFLTEGIFLGYCTVIGVAVLLVLSGSMVEPSSLVPTSISSSTMSLESKDGVGSALRLAAVCCEGVDWIVLVTAGNLVAPVTTSGEEEEVAVAGSIGAPVTVGNTSVVKVL